MTADSLQNTASSDSSDPFSGCARRAASRRALQPARAEPLACSKETQLARGRETTDSLGDICMEPLFALRNYSISFRSATAEARPSSAAETRDKERAKIRISEMDSRARPVPAPIYSDKISIRLNNGWPPMREAPREVGPVEVAAWRARDEILSRGT